MFKIDIDTKLALELVHPCRAEELFAIVERNRELFSRWLIWVEDSRSVEDTHNFIRSALQGYAEGKSIDCVVVYEGEAVGMIGMHGLHKRLYEVRQGDIGYWLDAMYHGIGIMTKAVSKMMEIGFEHYACEKMTIRCATQNERSCKIPKRLGFTHEGTFRKDIIVGGNVMDAHHFSLLREEWLEMRKTGSN